MYTKITKSLLLILIFPIGNCYAGWFGPSNFDECILERMKEAKSNYAAIAIAAACRNEFPKKEPVVEKKLPQELASEVIDQLILKCHGRTHTQADDERLDAWAYPWVGQLPDRDAPWCSLYNGNSEWTVSSLIIRIRDLDSEDYHDFNESMASCWPCGVGPLTTAAKPIYLNLSIFPREIDAEDISVFIVGGKGYKR